MGTNHLRILLKTQVIQQISGEAWDSAFLTTSQALSVWTTDHTSEDKVLDRFSDAVIASSPHPPRSSFNTKSSFFNTVSLSTYTDVRKPPSCFRWNKQCWEQRLMSSGINRKTHLPRGWGILSFLLLPPNCPIVSKGKAPWIWAQTVSKEMEPPVFVHSSSSGASDGGSGGRRGWLLPCWVAVPSL